MIQEVSKLSDNRLPSVPMLDLPCTGDPERDAQIIADRAKEINDEKKFYLDAMRAHPGFDSVPFGACEYIARLAAVKNRQAFEAGDRCARERRRLLRRSLRRKRNLELVGNTSG